MKKLLFILLSIAIAIATACTTEIQTNVGETKKEANKEIQAPEIISALDKGENIYLDNCIIYGDLDFTVLKNFSEITPQIRQIYIDRSLTFNRCVFLGRVSSYRQSPMITTVFRRNLSFIDCDFRDEADFTECTVEGNTFFSSSTFRKKIRLQSACFKYKVVYFTRTKYEDEALFQNSVFAEDVNFLHARFEKPAMFQNVTATGLMMFGAVYFGGYADFSYARADESVFRYAEFKDRFDFTGARIGTGINEQSE